MYLNNLNNLSNCVAYIGYLQCWLIGCIIEYLLQSFCSFKINLKKTMKIFEHLFMAVKNSKRLSSLYKFLLKLLFFHRKFYSWLNETQPLIIPQIQIASDLPNSLWYYHYTTPKDIPLRNRHMRFCKGRDITLQDLSQRNCCRSVITIQHKSGATCADEHSCERWKWQKQFGPR